MWQKISGFFTAPNYSKTLNIVVIVAIVAAIPFTVYIAQRQQETRQRAAEIPIVSPTPTPTPAP